LKVNEIDTWDRLGYTGHHPRWAMAFKFESPVGRTVVKSISVQIGRTGRVTPVARVEPVKISGTTISNVTLHNQEYIDLLELAEGDAIEVSRRGDVIPAVERVLEKNDAGNATWKMPPSCPTCHSELVRDGAHHFCSNPACSDQIRGRLRFFAARGQMDIESLGPETLDTLLDNGLVKDIQDIYRFRPDDLSALPGFGDKKISLIRKGIEASKSQPFQRVLVSLGIPDLGQKAVELLVEGGFRSIEDLLDAADRDDVEALAAIHGIGEKTAGGILEELRKPEIRERIDGLRKAGLAFDAGETPGLVDSRFENQIWCVTGSFDNFKPRDRAMEEVKKRGGKVSSSVSTRTTHLLAGSNPGSKLTKAQSLGVAIVTEQEFLGLLR
jgi:DNA ligase (NAD+)